MVTSQVYVGPSPRTITNKYQTYTSTLAPLFECKIKFQLFSAASLEFESPNYYGDASQVQAIGLHKRFGGLLYDRKETMNGYSYKCLDHTQRMFGKSTISEKNFTISNVIKKIVASIGLPTSGIMKTTTNHTEFTVKDSKRYDICQQLANLEGLEFLVNQDGIPILRKFPDATKGYVFYTEAAAEDYSLDYNAENIVTIVRVRGKDDKALYTYSDSNLIVKYGLIDEIVSDGNLTTYAQAKIKAMNTIRDKARVQFTGTITIPSILDIGGGEWCIFVPPKWSKQKAKIYYTQSVELDIANGTTTIQFLDGRPVPPSNFLYNDIWKNTVIGSSSTNSEACSTSSVGKTFRKCFLISDDNYGKATDVAFMQRVAAGLKKKGIQAYVYGWRVS